MSQLTEGDIAILAAMFARSNMGHGFAEDHRIKSLKRDKDKVTISLAVCDLCSEFMESDEHEEIFEEEGNMWADYLRKEKNAPETHADIFNQYNRV